MNTVDSVLNKLRSITQHIPYLDFKFYKSIRLTHSSEDSNHGNGGEWTQKLERMGYFVENCVDVQLFNDPHGCVYGKNIRFEHQSQGLNAQIGIGIIQ
jgi:hypothetical protein